MILKHKRVLGIILHNAWFLLLQEMIFVCVH